MGVSRSSGEEGKKGRRVRMVLKYKEKRADLIAPQRSFDLAKKKWGA